MASSNQSAVSYVRNARLDLVGQLQNLPLIVEKLHQQGVFNSEEVSNIEALHERYSKTRKILDWTVNKGEEACYQFLRILDQERKSVFPKVHSSDQASKLHTWITSFSFRDEPVDDYIHGPSSCREFQTLLKTRQTEILEQQCRKRLHSFGVKGVQQNFKFIPLVLDKDKEKNTLHSKIKLKSKKCKKPRTKKMRAYIPRDTHQKCPEDLLNSREKRILLVGKPGIGKTTVVKQMLHHWAERRDGNLDFMFYFDENALSSAPLSSATVMDLLLDPFLIAGQLKDKAEEISQYLQNHSEKVTIIFDGITDLNENSILFRIMEHDILPEAKIVATCRPEAEDDFCDWPTCTVYVQGFSEESIYDYFTEMSDHDPDLISSVVNNPALFSLCHVPMYAFMVAVCFSYCSPEGVKKQWTVSELYIRIFRHCVQRHGKKNLRDLDKHIKTCRDTIFHLAESAFSATKSKTINLEFDYDDKSVADTFLRSVSDVSPAFSRTYSAFLHNTMQEFFSALWLLEKPQQLDEVLELCQTEVSNMKHVIHVLCGLQSGISIPLLKCLFQPDQVKETYTDFFEKFLNTFLLNPPDGEIDVPFICQCLYELQSPEACCSFLDNINHHLDLSGTHLDPYICCAVSYVISHSRNGQVFLDLENSTVPASELKTILKHSSCLRDFPSTLCQLWTSSLNHVQINHSINLLQLCGNEIHLPVSSQTSVLQRTGEIITQRPEKTNLHLHCDKDPHQITKDLCSSVCTWLKHIGSLCFLPKQAESLEECEKRFKPFKLDLCLQAAVHPSKIIQRNLDKVIPVQCEENCDFLLDLYSHMKKHEIKSGRSLIPELLQVYQSPKVWYIKLSERKSSLLLEVLKLQTKKKPVELRDCSDEESEVRSFLQCLPYISHMSCVPNERESMEECEKRFRLIKWDLCLQAALQPHTDIEKTLRKIIPAQHEEQCDFLLDLYSHMKQYETETDRSLIAALLPVYQLPKVWSIDLSERKSSLLLEVLKLQTEKKPVDLRDCSDDKTEVRSFLQCLPYISHLRFNLYELYNEFDAIQLLINLSIAAADCQSDKGENITELLASVCRCKTFPFIEEFYKLGIDQSEFVLDLYSHMKQCETERGRNIIPELLPVYQSPTVWSIKLSERKSSILLEVLKLQTKKKPVELIDCSDEQSEVRSFLQCLPYISQLRLDRVYSNKKREIKSHAEFLLKILHLAVERKTGEKTLELLTSLCTYRPFPFVEINTVNQSDFLLDLYSHMKQYETETGRSSIPALLAVYQLPTVWSIKLSERKSSLLLEVLKLQTEKKPVKLRDCSDEESEVRSFLQCLQYISQLRFNPDVFDRQNDAIRFLINLSTAAADCQTHEGGNITELLASVCSYNTFPLGEEYYGMEIYQSYFLLDLYSHMKQYETETGRSLIPALLPVYQSPTVWYIKLSEEKSSLLLEVLKLQTEKKPVELIYCSDEESEVRSFLQCLPYISQLRLNRDVFDRQNDAIRFLINLSIAAADCPSPEGGNITELLASLWSHNTFPLGEEYYGKEIQQSDFLLDLYSHMKQYETETGRSLIPALLPVYQLPTVWSIKLSERKSSLLLEVLKLQREKKPVKLIDYSDEESEVRSFLQCLSYISQLRFHPDVFYRQNGAIRFLINLSTAAADCPSLEGGNITELLASLWSHNTFPLGEEDDEMETYQSDFLLDLYSHMKQHETETGRSLIPALLPVYQLPTVWYIELSERKSSLLLEVLKLQTEKKPVELRDYSDEESEVRSFLQCLPYISQLRCNQILIPDLSKLIVDYRDQKETVKALLEALDYTLIINWILPSHQCRTLGEVLRLSVSRLKLTLKPQAISLQGVRLLFRHTKHILKLWLSDRVVERMSRAFQPVRDAAPMVIQELYLVLDRQAPMKLSKVLSNLTSLLNLWSVHCLNLTECNMEAPALTGLMCHPGSFTIRLPKETLQQFADLVFETQDRELNHFFLNKVGGDLTSCCFSWEELIFFLKERVCRISVNMRISNISKQQVRELLPLLSEVQFRRLSPRVMLSIIREIYETRSAHCVINLLSSAKNSINLNNTELDSHHCAALCFTLQNCRAVSLSLLWTCIPEGELERNLLLLKRVSQLSVDRIMLLRLIHCCSISEDQKGAALAVLSALQNRLDFSSSVGLDLTAEVQDQVLHLTAKDCTDIVQTIMSSNEPTELILEDCEVEDAGVDLLFSILHTVKLRCSKSLLLQFLSLLQTGTESVYVRQAANLSKALDGQVDLSGNKLDLQACKSLALVLEYSEGLSELDLSHCQLTDQCLDLLIPHLHKTAVLDLSHNRISDSLARRIYTVVSDKSNIQTVRLFNNRITDKQLFQKDKRFEIW